jgi:Family of unknown function (DUF6356)
MLNRAKAMFTSHPESLNESYFQHLSHAMGYSVRLFGASFCAFTHAILPFLFEKTASTAIKTMYGEMTSRGATAPIQTTQASPAE